ncbi:unnamed protein product [Citrullus colocynthis]|uniref:Uncharacterized protein n=1 Tax=Citrullus colocynthis TaxID=252529 RepID=A0ABP0Y851_9ROSI
MKFSLSRRKKKKKKRKKKWSSGDCGSTYLVPLMTASLSYPSPNVCCISTSFYNCYVNVHIILPNLLLRRSVREMELTFRVLLVSKYVFSFSTSDHFNPYS